MMRGGGGEGSGGNEELLQRLVDSLMDSAEHPPNQVEGVSDEFIEQLERIPKKALKADMSCPICANPFLEGMFAPHLHELRDHALLTDGCCRLTSPRCAAAVPQRPSVRSGVHPAVAEAQSDLSA